LLRGVLGAILFFGPLAVRCQGQQPAATPSGLSSSATVSIKGEVRATEGGRLPGVKVWAATLAAPARHLAATKTTATAEFTLRINLPGEEQGRETLLVAADLPGTWKPAT